MVYIKKATNGQFFVDATGGNNEKLNHSETEKAKASVWKNIAATAKQFGSALPFYVTDLSFEGRSVNYQCQIVDGKLEKVNPAKMLVIPSLKNILKRRK